jgi:LPS-assembly protein
MKNNFIISFISIFIFLFNNIISYADDFEFQASEIIILENGNLVKAKDGAQILSNDGIIINSKEFEYDKIKNVLVATGNVRVVDDINQLILSAPKIFYDKNNEIITTNQTTNILIKDQYKINSNSIIFDRKKMEVMSETKTKINDNLNNLFYLDTFKYWVLKKLLKANNVKLITNTTDEFLFNNAMINLNTNEIAGKDITINFSNTTFGNSNNQPRLKGKTIYSNKETTNISKGVFTTCKKRDGCPPWLISANNVSHDKTKKIIYYKDAWLKVYDVPVLYFPKFFHPDPTVKRQSGFLIPKLTTSNNLGTSFTLPYYNVISDNKDFTFSPRFYNNNKYLLQSEYRVVTKKTKHTIDASLLSGHETKIDKDNKNTRSHFFSKSSFNLGLSGFDTSSVSLDLQKTTNSDYLKSYKVNSPLITSTSSLSSIFNFEANKENLSLETSIELYENLSEPNPSDRYEFVYPNVKILKTFETGENLNGNLSLTTSGYKRQFNTNSEEAVLINDLLFDSNPLRQRNGLNNSYSFLIKNVNSEAKKSTSYRNDKSNKLLTTFLIDSSFPLKKERKNFNSFLTPKISMRYSPNPTKNISTSDQRLNINNIFSLERVGTNNSIEGGQSLTIGNEYRRTNKQNEELLSINLATIYRDKANVDLPVKSTMTKTQSDIVGNLKIFPNNFLKFDYDFSLDNNMDTMNYNSINTSLTVNNFVTTFEFMEENNSIGNESYIGNKTSYNFNENNSLGFSTRKNKRTNLREFYNLIYEYKNDCLVAGIEYNKAYYSTTTIKPEEQIFFSLTIIPFGKATTPDVRK